MAPNLVKSASLCSMDTSIHCLTLAAPQTQTSDSSYPPLTGAASVTIPQDNYSNYGYGYGHSFDNNNNNEEEADSIFGSKLGSNNRSTLRRTPSMLYQIIVEDEAKRAVSCELIETNLIADANKNYSNNNNNDNNDNNNKRCSSSSEAEDETEVKVIVNDNKSEEESYWDMPSEEYYDCEGDSDQVVDAASVTATSTQQVERLLVEDALRRAEEAASTAAVVVENAHPNHAYWDWPSEPILESEKRSNMIASIVLQEAIRQKLSVDYITNLEVQASNKKENEKMVQVEQDSDNYSPSQSSPSTSVSVDYWNWNANEEKVDVDIDDDIVAPHVHDATHPNHAYWDFPSKTAQSPDDVRNDLIDKILKEERIREILSIAAVTDGELHFHRLKHDKKKKMQQGRGHCEIPAPKSVLASVPADYWDFSSQEGFLSLVTATAAATAKAKAMSEKQQLIDRILKEEEQRFVLSMENIENHLSAASAHQHSEVEGEGAGGNTHQSQSNPSPSSYWDW